MKKIVILLILSITTFVNNGCKKFLNIDPIDDISGNNFWKSEGDVEAFTWGIYHQFRTATMSNLYFPAVGDLRLAPVGRGANQNRTYSTQLRNNNILKLIDVNDNTNSLYASFYNINRNTSWTRFYDIIQSCNMLQFEIDRLKDGILTESAKKRYKAEASFMRNLIYFFMIRQFGDVPYYTEAYETKALKRENMLSVLEKCVQDMELHKDDLPWRYTDASIVGIRAMKGSAIALSMHMNMWLAGFSKGSEKTQYYERVEKLGAEIMEGSNNIYQLLPIEQFQKIFLGKTNESLFEITQNLNYGEQFSNPSFWPNQVLRPPYIVRSETGVFVYYEKDYMRKLYPEATIDKRKQLWFDPQNIYHGGSEFVCLKFSNLYNEGTGGAVPNDSQIIFRYADVILLRAEALAELGRDDESKKYLNMVRNRAGLENTNLDGKDLKDEIFWERNRELMGEAHYFFDLVRTKKAVDPNYVTDPINVEDFEKGAWTWPLDKEVLLNNPNMTLNNFWL